MRRSGRQSAPAAAWAAKNAQPCLGSPPSGFAREKAAGMVRPMIEDATGSTRRPGLQRLRLRAQGVNERCAPPLKKSRPCLAGRTMPGWRGSHHPRRQSPISVYLAGGDVGCRARGAPTSSRARVEACRRHRSRADLRSRHTFDTGASCATPSREVMLRCSVISCLHAMAVSPGPQARDQPRWRRPSLV